MSLLIVNKPPSKWRWFIGDAEFGLNTKWACRRLRNQLTLFLRFRGWSLCIAMVLGWMGIGPLNLYKALGANRLIATARLVEMWRVEHEADGALLGILVQECLDTLSIDIRVLGQIQLLRGHLGLRNVARNRSKRGKGLCPSTEEW